MKKKRTVLPDAELAALAAGEMQRRGQAHLAFSYSEYAELKAYADALAARWGVKVSRADAVMRAVRKVRQ
jgi:hypothetical protein